MEPLFVAAVGAAEAVRSGIGGSRLRRRPARATGRSALIPGLPCTPRWRRERYEESPAKPLAQVMVLFIAQDQVADEPPNDAGYGPEPLYLHVREAAVPERPSLRHSETVQLPGSPPVALGVRL
jgi:hypothetical protein